MPKSTTAKGTTVRPPYKMKSAGTKWGIPPDSSGDSTPSPAPAQATMTEEQPTGEKVKISRLESVEKGAPDILVGDKLLPKAASEGDDGPSTTKPTSGGKKTLQKVKTVPVRATERGSGQSQVCEQSPTSESGSDDDWIPADRLEEWMVQEVKASTSESGMSAEDWMAKEYGMDDEWYPDKFEQGAFDGMSKDDADAKMAQIFRSCRQ
ncbi:hypothetical protein EDB19DRAFT_1772801 [Suillus lakei]|nr:hypothetical protein EDB19DRAFT_1772801 [Suillus lakei]